jgi:hypothetical protein
MPSEASAFRDDPRTVAVLPHMVPCLAEILRRGLDHDLATVGARQALTTALR